MKAAVYYRVSSKKQQDRESIDTQKLTLRPWIEAKGFDYDEFQDDGISGEEIEKRPGFKTMLEKSEDGNYQLWCFYHPNRIGRFKAPLDRARVMTAIINQHIPVLTYDGEDEKHYNPDKYRDQNRLERRLMDARTQAVDLAKNVKRGQDRVRREGRFASGGVPFGISWNTEEKTYEINEREYEILKEIVRLLKSGMGLNQTRDILNGSFEEYPTRSGKPWQTGTIWDIIRGDRIDGDTRKGDFYFTGVQIQNRMDKNRKPKPKSEWVHVDIGAQIGGLLFTEEEIREVRHMMSLRRKQRTNSEDTLFSSDDFLLKGLLQCGICGGKLSIHAMKPDGTKVYRYYKCQNRDKGKCTFKYVQADELDNRVLSKFLRTMKDPEKLTKKIVAEEFLPQSKRRDLEALVKKATEDLGEVKESQDRLWELYVDRKIDKAKFEDKETELLEAKAEAESLKRRAEQSLARPDQLMEAIQNAAQEMARIVNAIVKLDRRFNKWARSALEDHIMDLADLPDEKKRLIFGQMRSMLVRYVDATRKIKVWNVEKFELFGSLPEVNGGKSNPGPPNSSSLTSDSLVNIRVK